MATPTIWTAGLAGTGVDTATALPLICNAPVIWVSASGNDANAGTDPELPLLTIAQAVTNASANSVIAIAAGYTASISAQTVGTAGLRFVGFGTGVNRPRLTPTSGASAMFTVTAASVVFDSIYFGAAAATSGTAGRLTCNASGLQVLNCQMDCGASDGRGIILTTGADNARVENTVFTAVGLRPTQAITHGNAVTNAVYNNVTVDGSSFGWAGTAFNPASATNLVIKNLTLAGNSDLIAAVTSYQIFGVTTSGASRVALS